ncbi:MAG: cystathionine beta-lyase, partial [Ilumatobacter sp.]
EVALWNTTDPGDGVVVFTPIYYPFLDAIANSGRRRIEVPLISDGWKLDVEHFEAAIDDTTKIILFCHPHNPTGRIFDDDEIAAVADVAERHDLLVITDEIWGDLTHQPGFIPLGATDERFAGRLITLGSASKTFNLAGLRTAVAHIDHAPLTATLATMPGHLHGSPSTLGITGTITAWTACDDWLTVARRTIEVRRNQLATRLAADLPGVGFQLPQATYLGWLDFSVYDIGDDPSEWLLEHAQVALASGSKFGTGGRGHARINVATSPEILAKVIDRIATTLSTHRAEHFGSTP